MPRGCQIRTIPLTQGYKAIIDASDYPLISQFKWHVDVRKNGLCYAATSLNHPRRELRMHQLIMATDRVDHRDGDGLNNRRYNLRRATQQQNVHNSRPRKGKFKGVTFQSRLKKRPWQARIAINEHQLHLGYYRTAKEAATAYDKAAQIHYREFSRLNGTNVEPSKNHLYFVLERRLIPAPDRGRLLEYKLSCGHTHTMRAFQKSKLGQASHCKTCIALEVAT